MKLLIPFVLVITLVSCTDRTELYEKCADTKMTNYMEYAIDDDLSLDHLEKITTMKKEIPNLTLQEKLTFDDGRQFYGKMNYYSKFFAECEKLDETNPTTFNAMYE